AHRAWRFYSLRFALCAMRLYSSLQYSITPIEAKPLSSGLLLGFNDQSGQGGQKKPRALQRPTALKQKAAGKELTHGFGFLQEIPVTCQAADKPLRSSTTNTSCFFAVGFLGNRASVLLYINRLGHYTKLFAIVKKKSCALTQSRYRP
ncbi:MAG: hypothetical protein KAT27_11440, partial [Desulfobacterales bacterium]|nr:hypothetical protein [Desulfobacterales bacterium]